MPRRARPGRQLDGPPGRSGGDGAALSSGAAGGDDRVPGLAGGDDGVQVTQDRGRDHGLRLGGGELVLLACWSGAGSGPRRPGWRAALPRPRARPPAAARAGPGRSAWSGR